MCGTKTRLGTYFCTNGDDENNEDDDNNDDDVRSTTLQILQITF